MQRRQVIGLLAVFGLAACSMPGLEGNDERAAEARALYADLVMGRDDALLARMASINDPDTVRAQLPMMRRVAPAGPAPEPRPLGWRAFSGTNGQRYSIAHEYEYPDRFVNTDTVFLKEGEVWKVEGFNVNSRVKANATRTEEPVPAT